MPESPDFIVTSMTRPSTISDAIAGGTGTPSENDREMPSPPRDARIPEPISTRHVEVSYLRM